MVPAAPPAQTIDLLSTGTPTGQVTRVFGSAGAGHAGTPVCGGFDCNGDGFNDYAFASIQADPLGRNGAGEIYLIFGDGTIGGELDTAGFTNRILKIAGDQPFEVAGCEIWMDDISGDGLGDLMIGRQNFTPALGREGAGCVSILFGSTNLTAEAALLTYFDLRAPSLPMLHIHGSNAYDRLGIWLRTGDVTGDGVSDLVVSADQEDLNGEVNRGAAYLLRGGGLPTSGIVDLMDLSTALPGHLVRIEPPAGSGNYHLGATCTIADLNGNGRGELLLAATINRAGAGIRLPGTPAGASQSTAGAPRGKFFLAWDELFQDPWPAGHTVVLGDAPDSMTAISGETFNDSFGEELIGGLDYDGDGKAELFSGDLVADSINGSNSGTGHLFYDAEKLKGLNFSLTDAVLPPDVRFTRIEGPVVGALGADTVLQGDFDLDGLGDLGFGNPHDSPNGRSIAGSLHLLYGQPGGWPPIVDLKVANVPGPDVMRISLIQGALGSSGDTGDTLCYSAAAGDINGDGRADIIVNEMVGNGKDGLPKDVGNLLVISGGALLPPVPQIQLTGTDRFSFMVVTGEVYSIELRSNLLSGNWIKIIDNIRGMNEPFNILLPPLDDLQFYRVGVAPRP